MKVLIIEDNEHILSFLKRGLGEIGYIIEIAKDGEEGEYLLTINHYDIVILDLMLPKKDGMEVLRLLRKKNIKTPVLILSAKGNIKDKVNGLKIGADDYLAKPFSFDELQARLEALYRRNLSFGMNFLEFKQLSIDLNDKSVFIDDKKIKLSSKEFELLLFLVKHKNSIVSKSMIEDHLWSYEKNINSNVIEVTIYNLRKKLGKNIIKSFRNLGYTFENK